MSRGGQQRPDSSIPNTDSYVPPIYTLAEESYDSGLCIEQVTLQAQMLFETMLQGVVCQDASGYITMVNPAAEHMFGMTLEQMRHASSPYWKAIREDGSFFFAHNYPAMLALRTRKPISNVIMGFFHPEEQTYRWLNVSSVPLMRPGEDIPYQVQTVFQDYTKWKQRQDTLLETEQHIHTSNGDMEHLRHTFDGVLAMADLLCQDTCEADRLLEETNMLLYVSPENGYEHRLALLIRHLLSCQYVTLASLSADTGVLQPIEIVGYSEEYEHFWQHSLQGLRLSTLLPDPASISRLCAGEVVLSNMASPVFHEPSSYRFVVPLLYSGELIGILLLGYGNVKPQLSLSELRLIKLASRFAALAMQRARESGEKDDVLVALHTAHEELRRLMKMKSNIIATVSHEFRTALMGIQGFSEIIRDQDLSTDTVKEFAVDIHADARRLLHMITDMLDLERMETGNARLNVEWLNMNALLNEVVNRFQTVAPQHHIILRLAKALPILLGDKEKLAQVISNLLHNAIKYAPAGGEIIVCSQVEGNQVHVSISDQGIGIPATDLVRIFESYTGIKSGKARYLHGSGLGLSIAREIVQLHGGQIWAESSVGRGSVFHFTVRFNDE